MSENRRGERRRIIKPRATITQVLQSIQDIGDIEYSGNVSDNALKIFNTLPIDDRRTFLRKSLEALWARQVELAQKGMQEIVVDLDNEEEEDCDCHDHRQIRINPSDIGKERKSIEELNAEEQIRLKTWLSKFIFIVGFFGFLAVFVGSYFYGNGNTAITPDTIKDITGFIELLLKESS